MSDKALEEFLTGIVMSQQLIIGALIRKGILDKQEFLTLLDSMIEYYDKQFPGQFFTKPMKSIRGALQESLHHSLDEKSLKPRADWLRGVVDGDRQSNGKDQK